RGVKGSAIEGHDEEGQRGRLSAREAVRTREWQRRRQNDVKDARAARGGGVADRRKKKRRIAKERQGERTGRGKRPNGRTGTGIGQRGAFGAFLQSAPCRGALSEKKRDSDTERETDGRTNERMDGWTRQEGRGGGGIREGRKAKGARAREESSATRHATLDRRT
ncbi:hypothetical protein ALC53_13856, partial [Atta colombica]